MDLDSPEARELQQESVNIALRFIEHLSLPIRQQWAHLEPDTKER